MSHLPPTGMNTIPVAAPVPPQVAAVSSGSQYLRFKRRHQTIFVPCEPVELLAAVKLRLAAILQVDEEDIRLYECMTPERRRAVLSLLEEKLKEAAKLRKKKPGEPKTALEEELKAIEIPPLPEEKKLWELGLENDAIVYFVYRTHPNTDWEEWEAPDGSNNVVGACAGQIPGGDGFDEPGTAAARAAAAAEAAAQQQRQAQAQRDEEAKLLQPVSEPQSL